MVSLKDVETVEFYEKEGVEMVPHYYDCDLDLEGGWRDFCWRGNSGTFSRDPYVGERCALLEELIGSENKVVEVKVVKIGGIEMTMICRKHNGSKEIFMITHRGRGPHSHKRLDRRIELIRKDGGVGKFAILEEEWIFRRSV